MSRRPSNDDLMNLFVLQFDVHLPKNHEFYVGYLLWYNRDASDPVRNYAGLWRLIHDWVRRKRDTKNRKEALKDHLPGMHVAKGGYSANNKGKGKGKDGKPQVCFKWRDTGSCDGKDNSTCQYQHPKDQKGTGKSKGGGKNGKRSSTPSRQSGKGKDQGGRGGRSASPGKKMISDVAKLCKVYLKGKCKYADKCKHHHNGPCHFFNKGSCTKGDDCIFGHDPAAVSAATATVPPTAPKEGKDAAAKKKE